MGKYLHKYDSLDAFHMNYDNETEGPITSLTVNNAMAYTECSEWNTRTAATEYNGTYVFDRLMTGVAMHGCDDWDGTYDMMVFKKGNDTAYLINWDEDDPWTVDDEWISNHTDYFTLIHDLNNAYAVGDADLDVSSWETGEPPYHEPWVSYTLDDHDGGVLKIKVLCPQTPGHIYGAEYLGEDGNYYKWESYQYESGSNPGFDYYWTTMRNPKSGDNIFCSVTGIQEDNPCAVVGDVIEVGGNRVDYNKRRPGNH